MFQIVGDFQDLSIMTDALHATIVVKGLISLTRATVAIPEHCSLITMKHRSKLTKADQS